MTDLHFSAFDDVELDECDFALDPAVQTEINAMEHRSRQSQSMFESLIEEFGTTEECPFEMRSGYGYSYDVRAPHVYESPADKARSNDYH